MATKHCDAYIANFVLALPFQIKKTNEVYNLECNLLYQLTSNSTFTNIKWRKE